MNYDETLKYVLEKYSLSPSHHQGPTEFHMSRHAYGKPSLLTLWHDLGFLTGAEIGTEQGKYAEEILKVNPQAKLYCVDPWLAYDRYLDHRSQSKMDGFFEEALKRLQPYAPRVSMLRATSVEAALQFTDGSLDFVYIDGNHHFDFVVKDIIDWAPKVRPGGIIAGHDYRGKGKESPPIPFHVPQAVNAYTDAHEIRPWFVARCDKSASWFWVAE